MTPKFSSELKKTVSEYFGLKDFFRFKWTELVKDATIKNIDGRPGAKSSGNQVFWHHIVKKMIRPGDKIRLVDFQVSPWFPRKPGLYWTPDAKRAREYAMKNHIVTKGKSGIELDAYGKNLMTELGGIGCVNFTKGTENILITATSSGDTQQGIPLICSKKVWALLKKDISKGIPQSIDIDGEVVNLPDSSGTILFRAKGIPRVAVAVRSILNVAKNPSETPIIVTPWTIFKTENRIKPYGFTFASHNLYEDDMEDSVKWMQSYVERYKGTTIITDFDEELNPLGAIFPLRDVASGVITDTTMVKFLQQIDQDFQRQK